MISRFGMTLWNLDIHGHMVVVLNSRTVLFLGINQSPPRI